MREQVTTKLSDLLADASERYVDVNDKVLDRVVDVNRRAVSAAVHAADAVADRFDDVELPTFEFPTIDLPKIDLPKIDLPKIDLPGSTARARLAAVEDIELPKIDLAKDRPAGLASGRRRPLPRVRRAGGRGQPELPQSRDRAARRRGADGDLEGRHEVHPHDVCDDGRREACEGDGDQARTQEDRSAAHQEGGGEHELTPRRRWRHTRWVCRHRRARARCARSSEQRTIIGVRCGRERAGRDAGGVTQSEDDTVRSATMTAKDAAANPAERGLAALGDFIRSQRRIAELSQRELARLADLSDAYLSQLERGLHEPSVRVLNGLSRALNVPADRLLDFLGPHRRGRGRDDRAGDRHRPRVDRRTEAVAARRLSGVHRCQPHVVGCTTAVARPTASHDDSGAAG